MRFRRALLLGLCALPSVSFAIAPTDLLQFTQGICKNWNDKSQLQKELGELPIGTAIEQRGQRVGTRYHFAGTQADYAQLSVYGVPGRPRQFLAISYTDDNLPQLMVSLGTTCETRAMRRANFSADNSSAAPRLLSISVVDESLRSVGEPEWINPPLPETTEKPDTFSTTRSDNTNVLPVRVGMVDSGVNYQLPELFTRLARDTQGELVGYDFWDMDSLPFDANVVGDGFVVQRHGTRTASILLREAPGAELVPYRYPRPDMQRMKNLVEHAVANQVSIIGMPLGSNKLEDWKAFQLAAEANPQLLFIVSAGNNGRNIEQRPVYPAALDIANVLVVTSADDFVRPAERTNWGRLSVDFMLPAENIPALDFSGNEVAVSGSSYAVSRLVALVARLKQANPDWHAKELIRALRNRYTDGVGKRWVYSGYIADPRLLDFPSIPSSTDVAVEFKPLSIEPPISDQALAVEDGATDFSDLQLPLQVLVLDDRWTVTRINTVLSQALASLRQCGVFFSEVSAQRFTGSDYLRDLSTGTAKTLLEAAKTTGKTTVVFARDTRMEIPFTGEAFGQGNTRDRPWLRHSVWMTEDIADPGLALAHELVHVLSNNGDHVPDGTNLMSERTQAGQDRLDPWQCVLLRETGKRLSLLSAN